MVAWLLSYVRFQPETTRRDALAALVNAPDDAHMRRAHRVVFDTAEDFPTREQAEERLAAAEIMALIRYREEDAAKAGGSRVSQFRRK